MFSRRATSALRDRYERLTARERRSGDLAEDTRVSVYRITVGFLISTVCAVPIGIARGALETHPRGVRHEASAHRRHAEVHDDQREPRRQQHLRGRDGVTVNVGAIDGGGPVNVVPDRAVWLRALRIAIHLRKMNIHDMNDTAASSREIATVIAGRRQDSRTSRRSRRPKLSNRSLATALTCFLLWV